ncbi:MAG: FAD binding domain-containing protein [Spirochaetaceae bacterium]|nr:MAG: FAD binding domain-containing protein [Spirochaetaceae bacterium]
MLESAAKEVRVFRPKSLGGTLRLYTRNPGALLYAGGTEIAREAQCGSGRPLAIPQRVIYLGNVQELNRISRSQRYLDIGSALDLSRILKLGRNVLPPVLFETLSGIATPAVRNLATLGGNIALRSCRGDCLPALNVIDAQLELRTAGSTRWVGLEEFFDRSSLPGLRPGEILTRIRVPLEEWDFALFRKVGDRFGTTALSFAGVARFPKGNIETLHFCIGGLDRPVFRMVSLETRLKNSSLPVPSKLIDALLRDLEDALSDQVDDTPTGIYRRATSLRLFRWFLEKINTRSLEML